MLPANILKGMTPAVKAAITKETLKPYGFSDFHYTCYIVLFIVLYLESRLTTLKKSLSARGDVANFAPMS